jgi:hypothetical protein
MLCFVVCSVGAVRLMAQLCTKYGYSVISFMFHSAYSGCCLISNYGINYRKDKVMLSLLSFLKLKEIVL